VLCTLSRLLCIQSRKRKREEVLLRRKSSNLRGASLSTSKIERRVQSWGRH
jgi:hypothetical protein